MSDSEEYYSQEEEEEVDEEQLRIENEAKALKLKTAGNSFYQKGDYDRAIDHYRGAIELAPHVAAYYGNLAAACLMLKRYNKALQSALRAIDLDPQFVKAYLRAGHCYSQQGKWTSAKQMYQRALALEPTNKSIGDSLALIERVERLLRLGTASLEARHYSDALKKAQQARELADRALPAALLQCKALLALNQTEQVSSIAADFLRDDDQFVPLLAVRSRALAELGDINQAVKHLKKAHNLDPDDKQIIRLFKKLKKIERLKDEGNAMFSSSRHTNAIEKYGEALAQCVDENDKPIYGALRASLFGNRAASQLALRNYTAAIKDCTAALDLKPDYLKVLLRRAKAHSSAGNYQEAVYDYDAAAKQDQSRSTAQLLRQAKADLKQSKRKDYYKILGVPKTATQAQIKKGYRTEALKNHPDKASADDREAAEKRFKDVGEAYGVLSDETKRHKYDRGMDLEDIEQGGGMGGHSHHDAANIFAQMFGGGGGGFGGHSFGGGGFGGGGHRGYRGGHGF